jgi:hypothetical protein
LDQLWCDCWYVIQLVYWHSSAEMEKLGQDMANAFLQHLIGEPNAEVIRHRVEMSARTKGDDEFAEHYGLLKD